jgi:arginyl-tRNA--protein-N-Asp/Glu arginylyltransferase
MEGKPGDMVLRTVPILIGQPHPCPYLPEREARLAWLDRDWARVSGVYSSLAAAGFRRSGADV